MRFGVEGYADSLCDSCRVKRCKRQFKGRVMKCPDFKQYRSLAEDYVEEGIQTQRLMDKEYDA